MPVVIYNVTIVEGVTEMENRKTRQLEEKTETRDTKYNLTNNTQDSINSFNYHLSNKIHFLVIGGASPITSYK